MKLSAGVLLYRTDEQDALEVLIVHPGGPFWARKDDGAWSVPKGEYEPGQDPRETAEREFAEETGKELPTSDLWLLGELKQPSGKLVTVYAGRSDFDTEGCVSNTFELEWPRNSGRLRTFPEVDRIEWCTIAVAQQKLTKGQQPFLDLLVKQLTDRQ